VDRDPRTYLPLLRILSVTLLGVVGFQITYLLAQKDPLAEAPAGAGGLEPGAAGGSRAQGGPTAPAFPERYLAIDSSGIFGLAPKKEVQPALLGLAGRYAILLCPDGKTELVAEGGEAGGIKVRKIATNRVLIEYQGKEEELTIFSGLGSGSLLHEGKERTP
jgi:hypothetical protein